MLIRLRPTPSDIEVFKQVFINREYDYDFPHQIDTILDLGANIGLASQFFRLKYPNSVIAMVEPVQENYHLPEIDGPTYAFLAAIGPEMGLAKLSQPEGDERAMSTRTEPLPDGESAPEGEVTVPVIPVAQILIQLGWPRISLVKCDIEGAEDELFTVDNDWLHAVDAVMIELHEYIRPGVVQRVTDALKEKGIEWVANNGENAIYVRKRQTSPE